MKSSSGLSLPEIENELEELRERRRNLREEIRVIENRLHPLEEEHVDLLGALRRREQYPMIPDHMLDDDLDEPGY